MRRLFSHIFTFLSIVTLLYTSIIIPCSCWQQSAMYSRNPYVLLGQWNAYPFSPSLSFLQNSKTELKLSPSFDDNHDDDMNARERNDDIDNDESDFSISSAGSTSKSFRSVSATSITSSTSSTSSSSNSEKQATSNSNRSSINANASPPLSETTTTSIRSSSPLPMTKRPLELMWCNKEYCRDTARERVINEQNHIVLNGPATGQVAYYWADQQHKQQEYQRLKSKTSGTNSSSSSALMLRNTRTATILLLVKPKDEGLMQHAANVIRELVQTDNIHVLLDPMTAARLKHYFGVESDHIHLFEYQATPGFGSDLRPGDVPTDGEDRDSNVNSSFDSNNNDYNNARRDSVNQQLMSSAAQRQPQQSEQQQQHRSSMFPITPDLVCTLGGDGLLMHASMIFQGPSPPILCVSGGSLGFLTPFKVDEMVDAIRVSLGLSEHSPVVATEPMDEIDVFPPNMRSPSFNSLNMDTPRSSLFFGANDYVCLSIRMRLECRVLNRQGAIRARYNVLNEVVIDRGSSPYLAALECFCDDVHLTTVQADGIIFATPTGSTAYSMAAGGSVVHPSVPSILVTPICPHALSFRSMIFPDHVVLRCYVPDDARSEASVAFDGKHRQELRRGDSVQIQMSSYPVPTINRVNHSADWLGSLKRNFNFNSRPRQKPM